MSIKIFLITDYKGNFGSKFKDSPYRSGFDKKLVIDYFSKRNMQAEFLLPSDVHPASGMFADAFVLYTSQEDPGLHYKSFIEDLLYSLTLANVTIIPSFQLFKAHENKVLFEMIRAISRNSMVNNIRSSWYGSLEEFKNASKELVYPVVIKSFNGSMSRGVCIARNSSEAFSVADRLSRSLSYKHSLRDLLRSLRHRGYVKESWNRRKFIVQEYLPGLTKDFKVLIYGRKYYILERGTKKGDFRASGQGNNSFVRDLPAGLLDFSKECFDYFKTPHASLDIAQCGNKFYLLEAQFVYFGTYTIEFSPLYFQFQNDKWYCEERRSNLEEEYVNSVADFICE
jgi:glutathione synthase/RimK-type ligase-like ATP-grasp enzyme